MCPPCASVRPAVPMHRVPGTSDRSGVENEPYNFQSPCPFLLHYQKQGMLPGGLSMLVGFYYRDGSEVNNVLF